MRKLLAVLVATAVSIGSFLAVAESPAGAALIANSHQNVTLVDRQGHLRTVVANQSPAPGVPAEVQMYQVAASYMHNKSKIEALAESLCWDSYGCFFADANGGGQLIRIPNGQGINDLTQIQCPVTLGCRAGTFNDSLTSWASNWNFTGYVDAHYGCHDGLCWRLEQLPRGAYRNVPANANDQISSILG
ncbi:hypothetical protein [Fodinicola feengrottensis]|uniref:Uncharacterized protein n=1 Tax=Fodinicola feengrottensis TaxID=435914 RepID=A0ABP4TFT9_9ACTN|nr:hypothetical protein [Fodinicola feengrottensis]